MPFENLDIVPLGRPLRLEPAGLSQKIVGERRGGFCFELNGLFALLLEDLGFDVARVACRFVEGAGETDPFDHLALLVTPPGGEPWFADVGAGRTSPATPLPLPGPGETGPPGPPDPADAALTRIERSGDGVTTWRRAPGPPDRPDLPDGDWAPHLRFALTPRRLDDFAERCRFFETTPGSHFRQGPLCTRLTPEGRVSIRPGMLTVTAAGVRTETLLPDDTALHAALRAHFAIDLETYALAQAVRPQGDPVP